MSPERLSTKDRGPQVDSGTALDERVQAAVSALFVCLTSTCLRICFASSPGLKAIYHWIDLLFSSREDEKAIGTSPESIRWELGDATGGKKRGPHSSTWICLKTGIKLPKCQWHMRVMPT